MAAHRRRDDMHQQIRTAPTTSPPDIEKLLERLKDGGVNIAAAGGGNLEFGGEFAFAVDDGMEDDAIRVLEKFGYPYRVIPEGDPRLTVCSMENRKGELHRCISRVAEENLKSGRIIRDLIIGAPESDEKPIRVPVQIFSEEVRTLQTVKQGATASQSGSRAR
jgi:hypothetical protein